MLTRLVADPSSPFAEYITSHQQDFIDRLAESVAIPSVSGDASYRPDVHRMGHWLKDKLVSLGVS